MHLGSCTHRCWELCVANNCIHTLHSFQVSMSSVKGTDSPRQSVLRLCGAACNRLQLAWRTATHKNGSVRSFTHKSSLALSGVKKFQYSRAEVKAEP